MSMRQAFVLKLLVYDLEDGKKYLIFICFLNDKRQSNSRTVRSEAVAMNTQNHESTIMFNPSDYPCRILIGKQN